MLEVKNISFGYNQHIILKNIEFNVSNGQNITIIGESGCGKSTLLKLIYGLFDVNEGEILFNKKPILGPKFNLIPGEEYIKYLAQDFGLMPYMTVAENVGKFLSNTNKKKKNDRIDELLKMVEMQDFAIIKPQFLSGGQQQRVGLAMVLANEPKILLLDEPFSQIDNFRKNTLRRNLFNYLKSKSITCLIATHDVNDVLSFSDQTVVLKNGAIVAKNSPEILFKNPQTKYIGSLFGEINEIEIANKIQLVYSHQIKIVTKSEIKVKVVKNYFRGTHYLIAIIYKDKLMFLDSINAFEINTELFLEIKF